MIWSSFTNSMYEMILFVNNRQEPNGCILFWPPSQVYISVRYIVMVEDNQGGGAMDLDATPVG